MIKLSWSWGGGFAGLQAAKALANERGIQVLLLDRRNHHLFQPLLYQVATAGLNPADIAAPIRAQFKDAPNVEVHLARVEGANLTERYVWGGGREVEYDYLIVATGSLHSYFGHDEWEPFAPGLKTLEQATEIRRRLLLAFESAEMLNTSVNEIDASGIRTGLQRIASQAVFWGAGVQAAPFEFRPSVSTDRVGRVSVEPDLSLPGHPEVFVAGDMASVKLATGELLPGLAPAAMQAGRKCAASILSDFKHQPRTPFEYHDKGMMATIGKSRAVARSGRLLLTGLVTWLAWLFIHVYYLIGFKNRIGVLWLWTWSYLFSKRGSRLITEREWRLRS